MSAVDPQVNVGPKKANAVKDDLRSTLEETHSSSFDISLRDIVVSPRTLINKFWLSLVSFAALLDFCCTLAFDYHMAHLPEVTEEIKQNPFELRKQKSQIEEVPEWKARLEDTIHWMATYKVEFAILFSLMWFTDAFVKAQRKRDLKLRELDKQRLQEQNNEEISDEKLGAWGTYYWAVFVQLLLLPVSFYLVVAYHLRVPMPPDLAKKALGDDEDLEITFHNKDGSVDHLHSFTTSTTQTLAYAILRYSTTVLTRITGVRVKAKIRAFAASIARRMAFFSIRNPRRAAQRFRKLRTALRWLKYLAPLIATSNKLRGNVIDLFKKYRQRRAAKDAQKVREKLWKQQKSTLDPKELESRAAVLIQSKFRARRAQRAVRALQLFIGKKAELACIKMQKILRKKLAQARHRLFLKKLELQKLQQKQQDMKKAKGELSIAERRRLYELQDELGAEARELINKKLLLRPNTSFAVMWKIVFVVCVLFEISQLALAPTLKKYVNKKTGKQMDIEEILGYNLVPTPVAEMKECGFVNKTSNPDPENEQPKVLRWLQNARPQRPKFLKPKEPETYPWYCQEPIKTTQWFYVQVLKLLVHEFLVVVGIVCFLDVFITFFTGELHPENGTLIPKPFFTRWILPGIVLQLFVNPQMETVGRWVFSLMKEIMKAGPILVYRWSAALFYPLFIAAVYYIDHYVWRPLVKLENKAVCSWKKKSETAGTDVLVPKVNNDPAKKLKKL